MLSRLNLEHILACSKLLNISNSPSLTDLIISFICEWILPDENRQLFLLQLWAHSQSVILRMRKVVNCNQKCKFSNQVDDRYFSYFFSLILPRFYCFFNSETYRKQTFVHRLRGGMPARLTPDQKVVCSSHVGISCLLFPTLNWSGFHWIVLLCRKKAARFTALYLLLNATSS